MPIVSTIVFVIGWIAWVWVLWIAIMQLAAIPDCWREHGSINVHLIRNIVLFFMAVVLGLAMGTGQIHLVWIPWLLLYFPSTWNHWWVRLGFGCEPHPRVLSYTLAFGALMLGLSSVPSHNLTGVIADGLGWTVGVVDATIFALGIGAAFVVRREFWRQARNVNCIEQLNCLAEGH